MHFEENLPSSSKVTALHYMAYVGLFTQRFGNSLRQVKYSVTQSYIQKIVISNNHAKPLIIKNFFSNHSFAAIQVFFFISRFQTSIHRYLCIRF